MTVTSNKITALVLKATFKTLQCSAFRIVEDQHNSSTRKLVDSLAEHDILENLIDDIKPKLLDEFKHLHYLLFTPFRYPPLDYGSRFGGRYEPSLWYGSLQCDTALAEKAFYQFHFIRACLGDLKLIERLFTAFETKVYTKAALNLTEDPFDHYTGHISSPRCYQQSQALGTKMRNEGIEAFIYQSARCADKGKNIGLFSHKAFANTKPLANTQTWRASCQHNVVEFTRDSINNDKKIFEIEDFLIDGEFPLPPN